MRIDILYSTYIMGLLLCIMYSDTNMKPLKQPINRIMFFIDVFKYNYSYFLNALNHSVSV